jgi:hypothetical protein
MVLMAFYQIALLLFLKYISLRFPTISLNVSCLDFGITTYCLRILKCLIYFVLYQVLGKSWSEQRMAVADGVDGHDVVLGQRIRGRGENGERCSRSGR